ncbi:helix-turn-helix domain-containing protein [Haloechinothrix salitolerans]|uniref:Helix-turn-helix domain-containing protein n=1 Tax=Haloechinothrix salitolerans TaxID=926830 RepID=A0ABW2BTU8_9PSEU
MFWNDFLRLLARDAAAVEFEGPLLAARARGEPPEVIEELEEGKHLALQVREMLASRRRREGQLTALFETAGDLARLSDLDSVLNAIVRRARQLLGTDIAYLTMHDPVRGDTYMRVTDGSTSAAFQQLRLSFGEGLGGLVAQTGMPYFTSNYMSDPQFRHVHTIDSAVEQEGLVSILGVPLQIGSRVIGVLFAANRAERPFTREEVALLGSLAAHAAVAIDQARLLEETRVALDELNSANRLLQEHSEAVERAAAAHDKMAQLVLTGGGVAELAVSTVEVIGGSLLVLDEHDRELASVANPESIEPQSLRGAVAASRASGRSVRESGHWVAAVSAGTEHLGALVLSGKHELEDADQRILERAAVVTALLLLARRSGAEAESRVRGELLDDLLRRSDLDRAALDALTARADRLGADLDAPYSVYVADVGSADRQRAILAANHIARTRYGLGGSFDGKIVLLLPTEEPGKEAAALASELGPTLSAEVTVGGAGPARGAANVASTYAEAQRCLGALRTLGRTGEGASAAEIGFVGLVLSDQPDVSGFVDAQLGAIVDYDDRRGTELISTLRTYFACNGNLAKTKDALHVHVNTVAQRLDRISRLIGDDWQAPERMLELQLALRLHQLRHGKR